MKKNIAIVAGGDSGEYEISIKSAELVNNYLNEEKYNAFLIVIKGSDWYYTDENGVCIDVNKEDFSLTLKDNVIKFDVVFNVIHGTPGEDGIIQGYFDLLNIPYTSSDVATSSLTFNKSFCNKVVASFGINVASSIHLFKNKIFDVDDILEKLSLPLFVKPNNGGSSVAITKVNEKGELKNAIYFAFTEDNEVLVEEFIHGREISCGVFNFKEKIMVFPITEIVTKNDFFDYEAKYTPGITDEITPADISEEVDTECKAISVELYHQLNCKGVVRFDYIFNDNGIWFLEVNTVPGFSEQSIIPQQAQAFGISNSELFEMMIENIYL
jgi:D-alanine-D-alanine ligase